MGRLLIDPVSLLCFVDLPAASTLVEADFSVN